MHSINTFLCESSFFCLVLSLLGYEVGLQLKRRFKSALFNPLLISIVFVMGALKILNIDYDTFQDRTTILSYLLTPATVCLAIPLYQQLELLKKNMAAILLGILSGVLASLGGVLVLCAAFGLPREIYATLLPKSITTAIGMGISEELGGIVTITVAVIIITGVFGNIFAEMICRIFKITHPIAKGLAVGTASHAVGTAKAIEMGEVEGAMSSLAIAVAGLMTVVGASVFFQAGVHLL